MSCTVPFPDTESVGVIERHRAAVDVSLLKHSDKRHVVDHGFGSHGHLRLLALDEGNVKVRHDPGVATHLLRINATGGRVVQRILVEEFEYMIRARGRFHADGAW